MTETRGDEPVLGPSSNALEALKKATFTEPKHIRKPNGQEITTRLVREGAGMVGLENRVENQEWAGIFNHYVKTAGASLQLGRLLQLNGQKVDLQLMLDTVMLSHSGRRQYDEATWYPEQVDNATKKRELGDTQIGLTNLKSKHLPPELIDMISVHGLGTIYPFEATKTWNEKLPMYLDFRIAQNAMPMEQRFIDLQRGVAAGRYTQDFLDKTHEWAIGREEELFEALHIPSYEAIASNPQNLKARIDTAIKAGRFTETEVTALKETKLYKPKSGKDGDIAEIVGLKPEEFLERLHLHPEDINDQLLQPERWERYIRRLYINDAEQGIFARLSQLHRDIEAGKVGSAEELDKEFPINTWWGKYARELYDKRHGVPLHSRDHKQIGIARAIGFYGQIEQDRVESKFGDTSR
ncbi:MAG: hypothetical protein NUV65_00880 [Candidatus Roizmanbacteria bacterium]|nr:hypothetical protein [Candidatus Roizmanbacteria bacterium]